MTGVVASPTTPWVNYQRMVTQSGDLVAWSGTNWVGGPAPALGRSEPVPAEQSRKPKQK